jgi:hypothetical protein
MMKALVLVAAMLFIPLLAKADSVWTYQGNAVSAPGVLSSGDGALTGTVILNSNNQVESWSFSAPLGLVFTNSNSIDVSFNLFNCASCSGTPFQGWSISMLAPSLPAPPFGASLLSSWNPDTGDGFDYVTNHDGGLGEVWVVDNPGVWTEVATSTPEPSSLVSLLAGLTALGLVISRLKL